MGAMNINRQTLVAVVLLTSLTCNVFLGGFLLGKHLGHPHRGFPPPPGMEPPPPELNFLRELPPESRDKIRPLLQAHRKAMQPEFEQMRQAQQAVFEQLAAENFNATALATAFSQLQQERSRVHDIMSQLMVNAASQLDKNERLALAKSMRSRRGHHPPPPPPDQND
jgi:uncharacterized membrane protein